MPTSLLPFADSEGNIPLIVGFGVVSDLPSWGTPNATYLYGHEAFTHGYSSGYKTLHNFLTSKLQAAGANFTGHFTKDVKITTIMVAWGTQPGGRRDLDITVITESNIRSVMLLMVRREVDIISVVCDPPTCECRPLYLMQRLKPLKCGPLTW